MLNLQSLKKEKDQLRNFIDNRLQSHFDTNLVNLSKRVRLEADLEKWKTDTIDMQAQATGKSARWYSIYFDNEFVCSFSMDRTPGEVELLFLNNLSKLFESEEIFFDKNEYIIREEARKAKEREAKEKADKIVKSAPNEVKKVIKELDATAT
jgi:hypothetical protein